MLADIIILGLIAAYCIYLVRREIKNMKEGKTTGCAGCSGCGSLGGCSGCSGCDAGLPRSSSEKNEGGH